VGRGGLIWECKYRGFWIKKEVGKKNDWVSDVGNDVGAGRETCYICVLFLLWEFGDR
jgi:hypothetical protein